MKKLAIVGAALLAACGGKQGGAIGSRGGAQPHGPVLVFVGISSTMVFEAGCHDPGGNCDELRKAAMDGTKQVHDGDLTFRITGTVSDECDASGATDVVGIERVSGPEDTAPMLLAYPPDVPLALENYGTRIVDVDQEPPPPPSVSPEVGAALARVATADLAAGDRARPVAPGDLTIEQVVSTDVDGDGRPDTLISANLPLGEEEGPGYVWSALVVLPGGDPAKAKSAWTSDLEHLTIDASFDLEGDGARELIFSAEYYEGSGRGIGSFIDGKLQFDSQWGCGA